MMSRGAGRVAGRADGRMASGRAAPGRRPPARGQRLRRRVGITFAITCSQPRRSGPKRLGSRHCGVALTTPSPPRWPPCCCSSPPAGEVSFHSRRAGMLDLIPVAHASPMLLLGACGHACSVVLVVPAAKSAVAAGLLPGAQTPRYRQFFEELLLLGHGDGAGSV